MEPIRIALAGTKNSGKSALFNALTGQHVHVGNYPGVTTDLQTGSLGVTYRRIWGRDVEVVDMPGLSSLNVFSPEEKSAVEYLIGNEADLILSVVDATSMEQGLYLAIQLLELNKPLVVALNMMDEAAANGVIVDLEQLEEVLHVPVIPISATKVQGIGELMEAASRTLSSHSYRKPVDYCSGALHKALHAIAHIIAAGADDQHISMRYAAQQMIAHDPEIAERIHVSEDDLHIIGHIIEKLEQDMGMDGETILATMRYRFVDQISEQCVRRQERTKERIRSEKIDRVATHKFWGIPLFLLVIVAVFWLTFSVVGGPLQELLDRAFGWFGGWIAQGMVAAGVSDWLIDLVVNGVIAGVGSVLSFLPIIMVLFFLLSFLEDSGYMTRVAFVMDKLLRKIGLSGRSFAPLIVGFGCNVPAIMATRTLPSERDRKLTILLTPFMSCSAKLPVYGMITAAFFSTHAALVMVSLYVLGIVIALIVGFVLSRTLYKGDSIMYVMELPNYRIPALRDVLRHMWDNAAEFVKKAFTIIFLGTVLIWFLQNFDISFNAVADSADSMLALFGTKICAIFAPIGLDNWQATTALIAGLAAKEAIVSTLAVLVGGGAEAAATAALAGIFTPLTAYVFLAFILLYVPCLATFATTRKELNSTAKALGIVVFQLVIAYVVCFILYHVGLLFI